MPIGCRSISFAPWFVEGMIGRESTLIHRRRRQRRESDDVTDGVDVFDLGAEIVVDVDTATFVGLRARRSPARVAP